MEITYSRGFYPGWLNGVAHQELVEGTFGHHRGLYLNKIEKVHFDSIEIKTDYNLKEGDGLYFATSDIARDSLGAKIYSRVKKKLKLKLFSKDFDTNKLIGLEVYLNHDKELFKKLE